MLERKRDYYLYDQAVDMRKSFNGLSGIVHNKRSRQVVDGSGYVFINKRRTHLKLLIWEEDGFSIYYKRLEQGTFGQPVVGSNLHNGFHRGIELLSPLYDLLVAELQQRCGCIDLPIQLLLLFPMMLLEANPIQMSF